MDDQLWQRGVNAKFDFHFDWGLPPDLPPFDHMAPDPIQHQSTDVGLEFMGAFDFGTPTPTDIVPVPLTEASDTAGHTEGHDSQENRARRYDKYLCSFFLTLVPGAQRVNPCEGITNMEGGGP